jgi:hypothetical protein
VSISRSRAAPGAPATCQARSLMMAAKFCSECGDRLVLRQTATLFRARCPRCDRKRRPVRLILISIHILCVVAGFAIGNYSKTPEPFYVIGTPIDLRSARQSADRIADPATGANKGGGSESRTASDARSVETICGAPTKSGRPCRRKVKGGGYCWQHRNSQPQIVQPKSDSASAH